MNQEMAEYVRKSDLAAKGGQNVRTITEGSLFVGFLLLLAFAFIFYRAGVGLKLQPPRMVEASEVVRAVCLLVMGLTGVVSALLIRRRVTFGLALGWIFAGTLIAGSLFLAGSFIIVHHAADWRRYIVPTMGLVLARAVIKGLLDGNTQRYMSERRPDDRSTAESCSREEQTTSRG